MIRRTFFELLSGLLLPRPILAAAKPAQAVRTPCANPSSWCPPAIPDPEWLREWRETPKLEVFLHDLPDHEDSHQRAVAEAILAHIQSSQPFTFLYHGGSLPGAVRTVLPTLLFSPDFCPYRMCYEDPTDLPDPSETPIYLLGWCQTRQAARNFRIDRMELLKTRIPN